MKKSLIIVTVIFMLTATSSILAKVTYQKNFSDLKSVLVYTGSVFYDEIPDEGINSLVNSNITDFIIIVANLKHHDMDYDKCFKIAVPDVIRLVNRFVAANPKVRLWLSAPWESDYNIEVIANHDKFARKFIGKIKAGLSEEIWENNIAGIYMDQERVYSEIDPENILVNREVAMMNRVSKYAHEELGKYFSWAPYYGYNILYQQIINNIAYVTDLTDIFDVVLIQPHYYFDHKLLTNLDGLQESLKLQKICNRDRTPVVQEKKSKTVIGIDMELDWHLPIIEKYPEYKVAYDKEVDTFKEFVNEYPFTYYVGYGKDGKDLVSLSKQYVEKLYNY